MKYEDIVKLLRYCVNEHAGCGLCEMKASGKCGAHRLKIEAANAIETLTGIIPHTCECCIGCELEQRCGSCNSFVLSPERAREYIYYLVRNDASASKS